MDGEHTRGKRTAIVSGGSGYIGGEIVRALVSHGWSVVVFSRQEPKMGVWRECDITDDESVRAAVGHVVREHKSISACIHAAAQTVSRTQLLEMTPDAFDAELAVAARGAFLLAKYAIPHMSPGAAFIGITSALIEPDIKSVARGAYVTSKYALRGFLRSLVAETKNKGVRVYAVAPGFSPGGLNSGVPLEVLSLLGTKSGAGVTDSAKIAELVLALCEDSTPHPPSTSIAIPGGASPL